MKEQQTTETGRVGGTSVDRRTFLKGVGATGAALSMPAATSQLASAQSLDPRSWPWQDAEKALADSIAFTVNPLGSTLGLESYQKQEGVIYGGVDALGDGVQTTANYLFGEMNASDDQIILDTYSEGKVIRDSLSMIWSQSFENLKLAENNAVVKGKYELVDGINNGDSKTQIGIKAREAVLDFFTVYERNVLIALESALARLVNLRDRQVTANEEPNIWFNTDGPKNGLDPSYNDDIIGLQEIEVVLVNGTTFTTKALVVGLANNNGREGISSDATELWIQPAFGYASVNTTVPDTADTYSMLTQDEYSAYDNEEIHVYVEAYDSNNSYYNPIPTPPDPDDNPNAGLYHYLSSEVVSRATTLADEVQTMVENAYDSYSAGEISLADIMDPYLMAQEYAVDWKDTKHFGYAAGMSWQLGYGGDLSKTWKVSHYDNSEDATTTLEGTLLLSPNISQKSFTKTFQTGTSWTYGSWVSLGTIDSTLVDNIDSHTATMPDGSGGTTTLTEDTDYKISIGDQPEIQFLSGGQVTEGTDVKVEFTGTVGQTRDFEVGNTYDVTNDGDYLMAVADGTMKKFMAGDTFTIEKLVDADGNDVSTVTTKNGNQQELTIKDLYKELEAIKTAQEDLSNTNPPEGGGGGGDGSSGGEFALPDLSGLDPYTIGGIAALILGGLYAYKATIDEILGSIFGGK